MILNRDIIFHGLVSTDPKASDLPAICPKTDRLSICSVKSSKIRTKYAKMI